MSANRRKSVAATAILAAVAIGTSACSGAPADETSSAAKELRYGVNQSLQDWDTRKATNSIFASLPFENLLGTSADTSALEPELATTWEVDGNTITFALRDDVTFHDGEAFNAEAVVANLEQIKSGTNKFTTSFAAISSIEAVDETSVRIELGAPYPTLLADLAGLGTEIHSPKSLADGSYVSSPAGTGPFVYDADASVSGSEEVFTAFDGYYAPDEVGPDKVTVVSIPDPSARYNALKSGQVNVIELAPEMVDRVEGDGLAISTSIQWQPHLEFLDRTAGSPLSDVKVRQAMCHALDLESMNAANFGGKAEISSQLVPEGSPGHSDAIDGYEYDVEKAQKLMAQAGNPELSFTLPVYGGVEVQHQIMAENLKEIGIDVTLAQLSRPQYFTAGLTTEFPVFYSSSGDFSTALAGPWSYYQQHLAPGGSYNPFGVTDPELDAIMAAGGALAAGSEEQAAEWKRAGERIHDEALACAFMGTPDVYAYDPEQIDSLEGQNYSPLQVIYRSVTFK